MTNIPPIIVIGVVIVGFAFVIWFLRERGIKEGWNTKWHEVWNPDTKQWERKRRRINDKEKNC